MRCPECKEGRMIKIHNLGMRHLQASDLYCLECGHKEPYPIRKVA